MTESPQTKNTPLPVLGIVGGIGSGKSYVASLFAQRGAVVLNADEYGHQALVQPNILAQVIAHWGEGILNSKGMVDRKKLGGIVFSNLNEKAKLEGLVFPYIRRSIEQEIELASQKSYVKLAILDAAIMLETGWRDACQAVIFVEADEAVRLQRVAKRGWDSVELHRREATQWPLEKKKALCQHIIPNNGDEVLTDTLVNALFSQYARQ